MKSKGEKLRDHWATLSPEERERRTAAMLATKQWLRRGQSWRESQSESQKRRWAEGRGGPQISRPCRTCAQDFKPRSGNQFYCSPWCLSFGRKAVTYKIHPRDAFLLYEQQKGRCALCCKKNGGWITRASTRTTRTSDGPSLVLDHCHTTGKVRGFLCADCNTALGRFGDDPERLRRAAAYIEGSLF